VIEFATSTAHAYVRYPLEQLLVVAERLGDELANERPPGPHTNSVAAIIVHCCAVAEFWLGHVALGRPTTRDRDAEFVAVATVAELREWVSGAIAQAADDLDAIARHGALANEARAFHTAADGTDTDLILHVVKDLFQHLGHAELTADVLLA